MRCRELMSFIFFFKQKTAYELRISDWSSDVCSSDLHDLLPILGCRTCAKLLAHADIGDVGDADGNAAAIGDDDRFEVVDPGRLARHTDQILLEIGRASCRERVCQYV